MGTNTTTTKNTFQLILAEYNADGSLNDIKSLDNSIFSCYLNSQDLVDFQSFGLHFIKTCTKTRTFSKAYYYDVYIVDANGNYSEVPLLISGTYYKRFTPANYSGIQLNFVSEPPLQVPYLTLTQPTSGGFVSTNSNAASTTLNYIPFLAIFGVFIFVFFVLSFYRYMRYNPD